MKVLVINSGSSSIKYQVFAMPEENVISKGLLERIGEAESNLKHTGNDKTKEVKKPVKDHAEGMTLIFSMLTDSEYGVIKDVSEIKAVGHRIVHGGSFTKSTLIDNSVIKEIEEYSDLSPLHNPPNLVGIKACQEILKDAKMVACFDTGFHQTMPEHSYLYALPYEYYEKYKVRRYGFHGTSHKYVYAEALKMLKKDSANVITCHLGNGASVTAIKNGESIDTSMGLTPLEGLIMGTRSGDMDPAIVTYLMDKTGCSTKEMNNILNKKSGLIGISEISNDMRNLIAEEDKGNKRASLAIKMFCYRIKKYVGSYMAALGTVDAIIFTGGIGENNAYIRSSVLENMEFFGIKVDHEKNKVARDAASFSHADSKIELLVISTDEEKAIAIDTYNIVK